jgi:hypothetical protein
MASRITFNRAAKALSIAALIVAGAALHTTGTAQAIVTVNRIAQPATDTGIALAPAKALAVTAPSAPGAWGGPRTGKEATLSERVADYRIDATLDPVRHTIDGRQQLTWRNRSQAEVRSVYLHLYMNAFESAGSTYFTEQRNGQSGFREDIATNKGEWGRIELRRVMQGAAKVSWSFVHPDNGPETDHTVVRFDLPAPVAPGGSTVLDIDFFTQLPRVVARTGYFGSFHLVAQWFPKIGVLELPGERGATAPRWNIHEHHQQSEFYADFGHYDVRLTVPSGYIVGATGELQGKPQEKNGKVTHHFVQGDVHDFAWTADSRSAAPLQETWTGIGSAPVLVSVHYPPEMAASARRAMKTVKESLTWFSAALGPYPYKTMTVVIPPYNASEAGGMEYPTFITATGLTTVDANTLAEFEIDAVTIHELGHNYFQGILASNETEEPLLDEGVNEYWQSRMMRERKQDIHPTTPFLKMIGFAPSFHIFDFQRAGSPQEEVSDPLGQSAYSRLQGIGPVYSRGATMLRDLEARIGKDAIERGFKEYYKRWKFRHPSLADLRETLAETSGQRAAVEAAFAQQVVGVARIDDRVHAFSSREEVPQPGTRQVKGAWVEEDREALDKRIEALRSAWEKAHPNAKDGEGPFPYHTIVTLRRRGAPVPQTVLVRFADGSSETAVWNNEERWARFSWIRASKAVSVELDPQRLHYLDANKLDDTRTLKKDGSASRRWSGDFAAIVTFILSLIASI